MGLQHTITFLRPLVCKCIQVHILAELFSAWSMGMCLCWDGDGGVLLHSLKAFSVSSLSTTPKPHTGVKNKNDKIKKIKHFIYLLINNGKKTTTSFVIINICSSSSSSNKTTTSALRVIVVIVIIIKIHPGDKQTDPKC